MTRGAIRDVENRRSIGGHAAGESLLPGRMRVRPITPNVSSAADFGRAAASRLCRVCGGSHYRPVSPCSVRAGYGFHHCCTREWRRDPTVECRETQKLRSRGRLRRRSPDSSRHDDCHAAASLFRDCAAPIPRLYEQPLPEWAHSVSREATVGVADLPHHGRHAPDMPQLSFPLSVPRIFSRTHHGTV